MNFERDAILTCATCGVEGPHELLYLSDHLCASKCGSCGVTQVYSDHLYAEYARDVAERGARLPVNLIRRSLRNPLEVILWPAKGIRKPMRLIGEMVQISRFEPPLRHGPRLPRRSPPAGSG